MSKLSFEQLVNLKLLMSVEGIGPAKIRSLLAKFRTTEKVLSAGLHSLAEAEGISTNLAKRIIRIHSSRKDVEEALEQELAVLDDIGAGIITVWDPEFPPLLKKIYDPPLVLYILGGLQEQENYMVSVVGTRMPTPYGKVQAEKIAQELALQNITILSGMARGIDSIAHNAALKNNGRTVAVIGSGLDVIYPPENKKLFNEIKEHGAVISEYPPGTKPDAVNFPKRNRIIAGLGLGCIVIETALAGGAMQTAAFALDANREVFAVPGNLGIRQAEGTNFLIQKGEAKLIRAAEDVLIELELKLKPVLGKNIPKQQVDLNMFEEKILSTLSGEPLQIDKIAALSSLSTSDCLVHLLSLEFKGLIKQLPGKVFAIL
jgi:DNA processing protein